MINKLYHIYRCSQLGSISSKKDDTLIEEQNRSRDEDDLWFDCEENAFLETDSDEELGNDDDFATEGDEEDGPACHSDKPIYQGSSVTIAQSALLILSFALKHSITGVCLSDLLSLIAVHCLTTDIIHSSLYKFRKYFSKLNSPLIIHKLCGHCDFSLAEEIDSCPNCNTNLIVDNNTSYFVEIPLLHQLQQLFQRKTFHHDLQHRRRRCKRMQNNIEDIDDGELYRSFSQKNGFLDDPNNVSFMWYMDGVPLFKSSKVSIWPMFLSINELPYSERIKPENMLFAGMWYGKSKPTMSLFLKPFYESLNELRNVGVEVDCEHCTKSFTVKGILLCGTCDLPAKCLMLNMAQFNGKYGCPRCKQDVCEVSSRFAYSHSRIFTHSHIRIFAYSDIRTFAYSDIRIFRYSHIQNLCIS